MRLGLPFACVAMVASLSAQQTGTPSNSPAAATGGIRGVITDASTSKPIRGVEVRVEGPTIPVRADAARFAVTDENGRYEIPALSAGRYTVTASKAGFTATTYGQLPMGANARPVEVRSGTVSDKIDISLRRGGVINVRVVDGDGVPVPRLIVMPFEQVFVDGIRQLQGARGATANVTDDRGEVRLYGLPPGDYYLAATPEHSASRPDHNLVQTLYPGTAVIAEAQAVRLGPAEERAVTWTMVRMNRVRISGVVLNANGAAMANASLQLRFERLGAFSTDTLTTGADGSFSKDNLVPGEYVIIRVPDIDQQIRLVSDVDRLVVTAKRQTRVQGRIVTDVAGPLPQITALRFHPLQPRPALTGLSTGGSVMLRISGDGSFDTPVWVGSGLLRLQRGTAGAGWFLKSVRIDGRDVPDGPIDFGTLEGRPVEVVVTQRRAAVTGTVVDRRAAPALDCLVVVFPAEAADWTAQTERIAVARPDQNGRFEIGGLAGGQYLIAAVDSLELGEERNADTLERLRRVAVLLTLADGQTGAANLRLDR